MSINYCSYRAKHELHDVLQCQPLVLSDDIIGYYTNPRATDAANATELGPELLTISGGSGVFCRGRRAAVGECGLAEVNKRGELIGPGRAGVLVESVQPIHIRATCSCSWVYVKTLGWVIIVLAL